MSAAPVTSVEYDHSYNFSQVQKIAIEPVHKDTIATVLLSDQMIDRLNAALAAALRGRGVTVVGETASADMLLYWQFVPEKSATLSTFDPALQQTIAGTVYVNMIDPAMAQSKWRASFDATLHYGSQPELATRRRQVAVTDIFSGFPPQVEQP